MEEGAKSSSHVVLEKEVVDRMLINIAKFIVHQRFGEDRLDTARIGLDPE